MSLRRLAEFMRAPIVLGAAIAMLVGTSLPLSAAVTRANTSGSEISGFYHNRTMFVVIGFPPGGGYDLYARLLAKHLGKHIPGNPTVVPQNMPGAGSLKAANYIYSVAPKDGSVIGIFGRSMGLEPLLGSDAAYDGTKFTWLGSVTNDVSLCVTWKTSPVKTWDDMLTKDFT